MKTGTDTYIQWKQNHYDQDAIKSYGRNIWHIPARKIPRLTAISPFLRNTLRRISPTLQQFFHPLFLRIFGKVNTLLQKGGGDLNYGPTFRVPGLRSLVQGPTSDMDPRSQVSHLTFEMGSGSQLPPKISRLVSHFLDMPIKKLPQNSVTLKKINWNVKPYI